MTPEEYNSLIKTLEIVKGMRMPPKKINGIYGAEKWSYAKRLFDERVDGEILEYWTKLLKDAKKKAKSASSNTKAKKVRHTQAKKNNRP